ncbi:MAG: VWA domain-containing protein [Sandaracinaceae bacterium]|nr:VWA domain-containing protein [Sandaracinaceae bacterium]
MKLLRQPLVFLFLCACGTSSYHGHGAQLEAVPDGPAETTTVVSSERDAEERGGYAPSAPTVAAGSTYAPSAEGGPVDELADIAGAGEGAQAAAPQTWRRASGAQRFATVSLGGGNTLELRDVRVRVHVEGFRARTVVDHIFYNPHERTLEGTFRYALPPEASVSSYAMFLGQGTQQPEFFGRGSDEEAMRRREVAMQGGSVQQVIDGVDPGAWGELRVGRLVRAEHGREVYENVTRRRVDPALVEEVAPNTFEARVFPIQAHGYHRVVVSYEQTLPRVGNELEYSFPVPEGALSSLDLALYADAATVGSMRYTGDYRGQALESPGNHAYGLRVQGNTQAGRASFRFRTRDAAAGVEALSGTDPSRNERHFALRLQGDESLSEGAGGGAADAVFLLDTSLSEHPERFAVDVALLRGILERSSGIQRFNVVTFDAGARWLTPTWQTNDAAGRARVEALLNDVLLEGATDLGAALDALHAPPMADAAGRAADVFLLSDGQITWGERDLPTLLRTRTSPWAATRVFAYRTGLGAENTDLLRRVADGGVFNCLSMESVPTCAVAHQRPALRVERVLVEGRGPAGARTSEVLVAGGAASFAPGTELLVVGRLDQPGAARVRLEGRLAGRTVSWTRDVELVPSGELASRAWAEVAVAHLLASHDEAHERLAVAIGQHYKVPSRVASFLVLETDAEYEQYALHDEPLAQALAQLGTLQEGGRRAASARTSWSRLRRVLENSSAHHRLGQLEQGRVLTQLSRFVAEGPVDFMPGRVAVPSLSRDDVGRGYRDGISHDPESVEHYRGEAQRRFEQRQLGAAVRALSSGVENAPASAEVARSLAYTLLSWGADAEAAELLFGVLEQRPYEPQSYRDLAGALWLQRPSMTALLFEAALAGEWDARFRGVLTVVQEEYALFAHALTRAQPESPLARWLAERQQALSLRVPAGDLRVTMTWNTDNTDIDLWVTDPANERCYYGHRDTAAGGHLLDDVTQGFGPERFQLERAPRGEYHVQAHYYSNNGNRLVADTYVTLTIARHVGTPQQQITRHVVRLASAGDQVSVARFRF